MWARAITILMLGTGAGEVPNPIAQNMRWASQDARTLKYGHEGYVRYFSFYNLPEKLRPLAIKVFSGHINLLSRSDEIVPVYVVPGTKNSVVRVVLSDYQINPETYGLLAGVDPYLHVQLQAKGQGATVPALALDLVEPGDYDARKREELKADLAALNEACRTYLGMGLLRADWFLNQTAAQVDRKPGYYDFLDVKDRKSFQRLIGFDEKESERFGELREAVAISTVSLQPRAIARYNSLGGAYWYSLDFRRATKGANPLRIFGEDIEKHVDAREEYGHLPNGLWATGVFDAKGVRQDAAPDFIATDWLSKSNDRRVHVNISCYRCHKDGGLKSIDGWARGLMDSTYLAQFKTLDEARAFRRAYAKKLTPYLDRDRKRFEDAIMEATTVPGLGKGLTGKEFSDAYAAYWERYEDARVDLEWAAADLGVTPAQWQGALVRQIALTGRVDPIFAGWLPGRKEALSIRQWEEAYPLAQTVLRGLAP